MTGRLLALVLLACTAVPVAAQWRTVDTFEIKGAYGLIIVPENWNGGLFIYAHGYSADERLVKPFPPDLTPANFLASVDRLFQATLLPTLDAYASATTTFRSAGWAVRDAVKDVENVRRYFVRRHGKPTHTYLWGHSGGGMVTSTVIEYVPLAYDGALPMCGPGAGARRNFNGAFDIRAVFDWVCRDVPESRFVCGVCSDGTSRCLIDADCPAGQQCGDREAAPAPEDGLTPECAEFLLDHPDRFSETRASAGGAFVNTQVAACFGDPTGPVPPSPAQLARKDLFLRATQIPESFIGTDVFFASVGMAEVVHRRTRGRHPWGNLGVEYDPPLLTALERTALNAGVHRAREDAAAARYLSRYYEPRGRTTTKVLTVHALDDGLVIPENQTKYRQAFEAAGRGDQLVQLFTSVGGHCGFVGELFPALDALTAWVERGEKPSTETVRAACPGCTFTDETPGPWGQRVVEREQRGIGVRTLVCGGLEGDCPSGTTCSDETLHCRAGRGHGPERDTGP